MVRAELLADGACGGLVFLGEMFVLVVVFCVFVCWRTCCRDRCRRCAADEREREGLVARFRVGLREELRLVFEALVNGRAACGFVDRGCAGGEESLFTERPEQTLARL